MKEADIAKLIQRLEEEYPEATHPDVAAKVRHLKQTYARELSTKKLLNRLGISRLGQDQPPASPFWAPPGRPKP